MLTRHLTPDGGPNMNGPQFPDTDSRHASKPACVSQRQRESADSLLTWGRTRSRVLGCLGRFRGWGTPKRFDCRSEPASPSPVDALAQSHSFSGNLTFRVVVLTSAAVRTTARARYHPPNLSAQPSIRIPQSAIPMASPNNVRITIIGPFSAPHRELRRRAKARHLPFVPSCLRASMPSWLWFPSLRHFVASPEIPRRLTPACAR